ncbi:tail assembly protein [Escherichia coli]|nr:tail assembly protein [Escherichia coli]
MSQLNEGLKTIRLYGVLGTTFGRVHRLAVRTPKEAVKALSVVIPGFEAFMNSSTQRGIEYAVFKGKKNIGESELTDKSGSLDIRIAPIITGSKRGGLFQTVLGVALIAAATIMTSGAALGFAAGFAAAGAWGTAALVGASMAIGGVMQMIAPQPTGLSMRESPDNKPSYAFGGPVNTTTQGNPVGVLYTQDNNREIGGAIASAGIYAEDQQ